jgi:hypothetical protein
MTRENSLLLWLPRILGIAMSLFLSLFALDAFAPGKPLLRALADFAVHLIPAAVVLMVVVLGWRRPWLGGIAFILLAAAYALSVGSRLDWMLAISAPMQAVGLLFLWSCRSHRHVGAG